jgi:hypothetical protein
MQSTLSIISLRPAGIPKTGAAPAIPYRGCEKVTKTRNGFHRRMDPGYDTLGSRYMLRRDNQPSGPGPIRRRRPSEPPP